MALLFRLTGSHRACAALLAFSYFWLCVALPWQHTHTHPQTTTSTPHAVACRKAGSVPTAAQRQAVLTSRHKETHCTACDWEVGYVSPALPALTPTLETPCSLLVITTFPRYLQRYVASKPSRAPPLT